MELERLWLVPLAAVLVVAVTVTVLVLGSSFVGQPEQPEWAAGLPELPAGHVACDVDPTYGLYKAEPDCPAPGPDTPEENILYCEGTSRTEFDPDSCYSPVTVQFSVPNDISVKATSSSGATVTYTSTNACHPPSGTTFPVGTTTVMCPYTDAAGNQAYKTFKVTVTHDDRGHGGGQQEEDVATRSVMPIRTTERSSPDQIRNDKIAFDLAGEAVPVVQDPEGMGMAEEDIWTINADGSDLAQLTTNSRYWDEYPTWSPDGRRIAYVKTDPNDQPDLPGKLYVMNSDGSNKTELPLPEGVEVIEPTWSPDGERIAFWDTIPPTSSALYITHVDGSGTVRKLSTPGLPDVAWRPTWSPDGTQIAFQANTDEYSSWSDIYVMKVSPKDETSGLRQLTDHPLAEENPAWSPDGTEIAFNSNRDRNSEIYKINVNSLREIRLTHSPLSDTEPTWSPDGEQIAYVKQKLAGGTHSSIYRMDSDGSNSTPVFEEERKYAFHPDWGPRP